MAESFCCLFGAVRLRTILRVAHNCKYSSSTPAAFLYPAPIVSALSTKFFLFVKSLHNNKKKPSNPNRSNARFNGLRMFDIFNTTYAALNSIENKMDGKLNEAVK